MSVTVNGILGLQSDSAFKANTWANGTTGGNNGVDWSSRHHVLTTALANKPEIELAPSSEPLEHLIPRVYAVCDYVLGGDRALRRGDTLSLDGMTTWTVAEVQDSSFTNGRVVRLTPNRNH